ncbi:hypothetical protein LINGRAHAP2_LOCUS26894 [Linum grandiflorum]
MTEREKPNSPPPPTELKDVGKKNNNASYSGQKLHYTNPPEAVNPDAATLRGQWRFAIKQYSRWYSQAWGTAILAGVSFFSLGWIIKGKNPLPSFKSDHNNTDPHPPSPPINDSDADSRS